MGEIIDINENLYSFSEKKIQKNSKISVGSSEKLYYTNYFSEPIIKENIGQHKEGLNDNIERFQKSVVIEEEKILSYGKLKFFDETKNYGFIVNEEDGCDIFVHFDDLLKAGITKEILKMARIGKNLKFSFHAMTYVGKYNKSRKAVELTLIPEQFQIHSNY